MSEVLLEELPAARGIIAVATLSVEKTLNSLSLPMIHVLTRALDDWHERDEVVAVVLRGAGDRAFCAGGDIQALHRAMVKNHAAGETLDDYPATFFEAEYRLDHRLHTYPKPVTVIGHGAVMGGGLGLFSGARLRIVTETTRIAMPEVTIGLFPDAGASWILEHLPGQTALFLGMTGAQLDAADAVFAGLATHVVDSADLATVLDALTGERYEGELETDAQRIRTCLSELNVASDHGRLEEHEPTIHAALPELPESIEEAVAGIRALPRGAAYLSRAVDTMERGCPTSVGIVVEQVRRLHALRPGLADCFRVELIVATHCARNPDFAEGVRALIVDKDNAPAWRYGSLDALPGDYVASHFEPPWRENPLHDLN